MMVSRKRTVKSEGFCLKLQMVNKGGTADKMFIRP